jgi:POT family proton-dependent oligopeptide transporter
MHAPAGPATVPSSPAIDDMLGHPKGLFVCFFTEMWERFSFYGMKALLLLFMLKHHLFGDQLGYAVLGAYAGLVYAVPVVGGLLADRLLGMRKAVTFGGLLLCAGHLGMAYEGHAATIDALGTVHRDQQALAAFYLSLALIICGVGFLKPNISTLVGLLYPERDPRRDSGYTLYYAGINLGGLFASLICGYVGEVYGWRFGFGAAGIGMLAGLGVFISGQPYLRGLAEPPSMAVLRRRVFAGLTLEHTIYLGSVLAAVLIALLMQLPQLVASVQYAVLAAWVLWLLWFVARQADRVKRERMVSIIFFVAMVLFFFALYEQTYASWLTFTDRLLDKDLFPALVVHDGGKHLPWSIVPLALSPFVVAFALARQGKRAMAALALLGVVALMFILHDALTLPQTAGSLTYLGSLFIVVLAPVVSWFWPWLARRGLNPHKTHKCVLGLALAGLSFLPLVAGTAEAGPGHLGSVWWLVLAYVIIEFGEVSLSPITLAAVSELSMPTVAAVMMSGWFLATSVSEQLASLFSSLASVEAPAGAVVDVAVMSSRYGVVFQNMVWLGLGAAALALLISPLVKRGMHGLR